MTGSGLGYRREGEQDGDVGWGWDITVRTRVDDEGVGAGVLRKGKWNAAGEGGEDVQDR